MRNSTFSVLLSVYEKEKPDFLRHSLESLLRQTRIPKEIIIVKDGKVGEELNNVMRNDPALDHKLTFVRHRYAPLTRPA